VWSDIKALIARSRRTGILLFVYSCNLLLTRVLAQHAVLSRQQSVKQAAGLGHCLKGKCQTLGKHHPEHHQAPKHCHLTSNTQAPTYYHTPTT
jgi:hypothetical protein